MKRRNKILLYIMGLLICLFLFFPPWLNRTFKGFTFEQVMFNIMMVTGETNLDALVTFIKDFLPVFIVYSLFMLVLFACMNAQFLPVIKVKIRSLIIKVKPLSLKFVKTLMTILLVFSTVFMMERIQLIQYIRRQVDRSTMIEENYVNPKDVDLVFPDVKRNVIHIVLESMETDFSRMTIDNQETNLIPNLMELAESNVTFTDRNKGGLLVAPATGWTAASLVAQTSGLPLKVALGNKYGNEGDFLPGAITFGDILEQEGYQNIFLLGSDAAFGGRENYYKKHGNYDIYDLNYMREIGKIPKDYKEFWGYEDQKLFQYAKETLLELDSKEKPFNLEILTVDSHFMDGYVDESCKLEYDIPYANAIACSDQKVVEFVKWVQTQDFYPNTTIVISGDHPTMNGEFMESFTFEDRRIYNVIINPAHKPVQSDERLATVMDIYPTMLSAMGVKIPGNQLALGVDLLSDTPTLVEKYGQEFYFAELDKISTFYNEHIIKGLDD